MVTLDIRPLILLLCMSPEFGTGLLDGLAKARAYEFAFIMQPLKLQGATGSTVAPTAIR